MIISSWEMNQNDVEIERFDIQYACWCLIRLTDSRRSLHLLVRYKAMITPTVGEYGTVKQRSPFLGNLLSLIITAMDNKKPSAQVVQRN